MKLSKKIIAFICLASGLISLTGCRSSAGTVVKTDHLSGESSTIYEQGRLAHHVTVTKIAYDEVNGFKRVHVTLNSHRNRQLLVDYRICWYDSNGMEIDPQTKTYRNLILEGRDSVTVTGVANSPAAVSSKLRLRETSQAL
jgi:uncharacterized protein YcfL